MRCVNIDWFEVYVLESASISVVGIERYMSQWGHKLVKRSYGTPQYNEMWYLYLEQKDEIPFCEIRRSPRTSEDGKSFLKPQSCHIRLTNSSCYRQYPVQELGMYLFKWQYTYISIKRVDICCDFNFFDSGDNPGQFVKAFLSGKYAKIHQSNIAIHGIDKWDGRQWNSVKWGSPASNVTTKLYNKTLEMQNNLKSYIIDSWHDAGLRVDIPVWRVEFSVKAAEKGFKNKTTGDQFKLKFENISTRNKALHLFNILAGQYFCFKFYEKGKRKDRCKDKILFKVSPYDLAYNPSTIASSKDFTRIDKIIRNRLRVYASSEGLPEETREAATCICEFIDYWFDIYKTK